MRRRQIPETGIMYMNNIISKFMECHKLYVRMIMNNELEKRWKHCGLFQITYAALAWRD